MILTIFKWLLNRVSIDKDLVLDILEVIVKHRDNPVTEKMITPIKTVIKS